MMQLHQDYQKFVEKNTIVVAIGPENAQDFRKFWDEHPFKFIGIPDENQAVLALYGQQIKLLKLGRMPAQILIDKAGIVRYVHYGSSMKDIPENSEIFSLIDTL